MKKKTDVKPETETVVVGVEKTPIDIRRAVITLVGDSPLICHRWSEKAKKEMLDKQMKKGKTAKVAKDPERDFFDSLYWLTPRPEKPTLKDIEEAEFGFPTIGFKAAAVSACRDIDGTKMTEARGRFHIDGELIRVFGTPEMREDMVRIGMGVADLRYRGEFKTWKVELPIRYNASAISQEQIINQFNIAGFAVGVGEWRPEKKGSFGMFHCE